MIKHIFLKSVFCSALSIYPFVSGAAITDIYSSYSELSKGEQESAYEVVAVQRHTSVAIIAPHGGGIESGTSEISKAIAADDLSYYLFEGKKPENNRTLHITSTNFDEPKGLEIVQSAQTVVAIHGMTGAEDVVAVGGLDETARDRVIEQLNDAGFRAVVAERLAGRDKNNICNKGRSGKGVQLEISRSLRDKLTGDHELLKLFADAVRRAVM